MQVLVTLAIFQTCATSSHDPGVLQAVLSRTTDCVGLVLMSPTAKRDAVFVSRMYVSANARACQCEGLPMRGPAIYWAMHWAIHWAIHLFGRSCTVERYPTAPTL
jgi:hypothetical protein